MTGIGTRIAGIQAMGPAALRDEWWRHHRTPPPRCLSRDFLIRGIAYKLQEKAHGGLSKATRRRLRTLATTFAATGPPVPFAHQPRPRAHLGAVVRGDAAVCRHRGRRRLRL